MILSRVALAFELSMGVLSAAQPENNTPMRATDISTQIAINNAAVQDNSVSSLADSGTNLFAAAASAMAAGPTGAEPASSDSPQASGHPQVTKPAHNNGWRLSVTPYLWLPGVHGRLGALGRDVNIHASPIDLLSHFRFGLMAAADARWQRLVVPVDFLWARLEDSRALPFPELAAITANVKAVMFVLTSKIGYRFADHERIKFDVVTGLRCWHIGQNLQFSPSILNLSSSASLNWVDPLVGTRIEVSLSRKFAVNFNGDVGGWSVGSQLDYQVAGLLIYKIRETMTLLAGYRYLNVNYRGVGAKAVLFDTALSGIALGVTIGLK